MRIFAPVTILSEDELGRLGVETHDRLDEFQLRKRLRELMKEDWEPVEVQVDEAQGAIDFDEFLEPLYCISYDMEGGVRKFKTEEEYLTFLKEEHERLLNE